MYLKKQGILGINSRNIDYIFKYNKRKDYHLLDNKVTTKEICQRTGIMVPETYMVINHQHEIKKIDAIQQKQFVIKPASGSGGNGIMIIVDKNRLGFVKANDRIISVNNIKYHISNIISGIYSISNISDQAIIEYKVNEVKELSRISYKGISDIRVILFQTIPVMAMLRVPTHQSDGKANLHAGGIGVGIDINTGITTNAIHENQDIKYHIDTAYDLIGIKIPLWEKILEIGKKFAKAVDLEYIGVDIIIDEDLGPMLIEANVRPGIQIQIANKSGLKGKLQEIGHIYKNGEKAT